MRNCLKTAIFLIATAATTSGCTIDRPSRSDLEGPSIDIAFSGGADFDLSHDARRATPADSCGIVRDIAGQTINDRNVHLNAVVIDQSGMARFRFTVEGEGIRRNSIQVIPTNNPRLNFSDTRDVDVIELTFFAESDGVLNGAALEFTIDSTFTGGVTISAFAVDTFGNESSLAPFELLSGLADGICNY